MPIQFVGPALTGAKAITTILGGVGTALSGYELAKMAGLLEPDTYRSSGFYGRGNKGRPGFSGPLGPMPRTQTSYGTLPPSARVVTDYPEGIPTGVGGGNAAQAQSLDPKAPGGGYIPPTPTFNPNRDLPASAEQSINTNPMQYQMALYEQGRGAAKTQAEMNQVRDVGLAIHKAHNPHLYSNFQAPMASDRTFNPQMSGIKTSMFPEGYPSTMEGFVKGGGVQMPFTMTDKDARNEVIAGNEKQGLAQLAEATQMLEEQAFMQEYLKELEKKKK